MSETDVMKRAMLAATKLKARLFRNNTGTGWVGKGKPRQDPVHGLVVNLKNARPLRAGLCTGSSDLIGWSPLKIEPHMVGKTVAIFTAVENKFAKGRASTEQDQFIGQVIKSGGRAGIARDKDDLADILCQEPNSAQ